MNNIFFAFIVSEILSNIKKKWISFEIFIHVLDLKMRYESFLNFNIYIIINSFIWKLFHAKFHKYLNKFKIFTNFYFKCIMFFCFISCWLIDDITTIAGIVMIIVNYFSIKYMILKSSVISYNKLEIALKMIKEFLV